MLRFLCACLSVTLILALLTGQGRLYAQPAYKIILHSQNDSSDAARVFRELPLPEGAMSQVTAYEYVQKLVPALQEKGFLAASVDSVVNNDQILHVYLFLGAKYRWAQISFGDIPVSLLSAASINMVQWTDQIISPRQIARLTEKILQSCEDNGFPFARVWLSDIRVNEKGETQGAFRLEKGSFRKIDSVLVEGNVRISKQYLMRYLDIFEGSAYSEKKLRAISSRLREVPFLREASPWHVSFKQLDTRLHLKLTDKKANQLNAIIGLMPNSQETRKFMLTADALIALHNVFGYGENVSVTYQNLQYRSPRLKADLVWPYLFRSAFGAEGHFDYYSKYDFTLNSVEFRRTMAQLGTRYQVSATDYLRLYYQIQSNRLITVDTNYVRTQHKLPDNADVFSSGLGLELVLDKTDYRINPGKGWSLRINVTGMQRNVRRSDAVLALQDGGFDFSSLYDSVNRKKYQYQLDGAFSGYIPLARMLTLKLGYNGGWISSSSLFRNELFQIGGFKLLRGFDEQSIYANMYHLAIAELRIRFDRNSYFYLFSDNAFVQSDFNGQKNQGFYNGFGAGTALESKSGIFTISYALGRSDNNPLQFRQSKIHFGYVAYF